MRNVTISTSVRPGRIAVLTDIHDKQWQSTCLRLIEYFTRMWGGCANIVIPTDGKTIAPVFWSILEAFDPDYLEAYQRTGADFEIEEPAEFEKQYQQQLASWEEQTGGKSGPDAANRIREILREFVPLRFEISAELQQQLKERLAPFFFQEWIVEAGTVRAQSRPHHPHTDVLDILQQAEYPRRIFQITGGGSLPKLWWAAAFGCLTDEVRSLLAKSSIDVFQRGDTPEEVKLLISLAVERYETSPFLTDASADQIQELLRAEPFRLSSVGLNAYRSVRHQDWTEPVVAVAGSSLEDFAVYYALSRMRDRVVWIPPSVTTDVLSNVQKKYSIDDGWYFINDLASLARGNNQRYAGMTIVSASLPTAELESIRTHVSRIAVADTSYCRLGIPAEALPMYPNRYYNTDNSSVSRSIAIQDDGIIPLFETPIPKNFKAVHPQKHRWLTELKISQYKIPRHPVMGERFIGGSQFTTSEARISSEGPTYFCPAAFILAGATAESSVPRPSIHIPDPLAIFRAAATSQGLTCETSDKGLYAESACKKFGGLAPLSEFLRSNVGQRFVAAFLDKTKPKRGDPRKGVLLGDRRYLDFDSFAAALGDEEVTRKILDQLSKNGGLYRGFVLKCEYCRYADWLPLAELTDRFTCNRCHRTQVFTSKHWRSPSQPNIYYQLDELVYLGLEHNMQVPVLALDFMKRSADSFLYVHEMAYRENDPDATPQEVDINCIADGLLSIGEAKKDGFLGVNEKEETAVIAKYRNLACTLGAHQVVFATCENQWRPITSSRMIKAFEDGRFKLTLLTRTNCTVTNRKVTASASKSSTPR